MAIRVWAKNKPTVQMELTEIETILGGLDFQEALRKSDSISESLSRLKREAVESSDQAAAAFIWCIEKVNEALRQYYSAFNLLKEGQYFECWLALDRFEIESSFIALRFKQEYERFAFPFIQSQVAKLQSLFPYKIFGSTEIVKKEVVCSICKVPRKPRSGCDHILGEIYDGESCGTIVTKWEPVGLAMTENPRHRFGVFFQLDSTGKRVDQYNYGILEYLGKVLESPYDDWLVERTKIRNPHSNYRRLGRNSHCPCGSKLKYKKCCLNESGVWMDHFEFTFPPYLVERAKMSSIEKPHGIYFNQTKA